MDLPVDQCTRRGKLKLCFHPLKASIGTHQHLAGIKHFAVIFIFDAQIMLQINTSFDHLAAAIAFDGKGVITLHRPGRFCSTEKFLKKAHVFLSAAFDFVFITVQFHTECA